MISLLILVSFARADCPDIVNGVSLSKVEKELKTKGVETWIHGAVPLYQLFVTTYRDSKNFFKYVDFSMITFDKKIQNQMKRLRRHDKVLVKGKYLETGSCFPHISVESLKIIKRYKTKPKLPRYRHTTDLSELEKLDRLVGKIHGVSQSQGIIAVEYGQAVVPVFVPKPHQKLLKNLYRNDLIDIALFVRASPGRPIHIELDVDKKEPLKVLSSMVVGHGEKLKLQGELAMFPKSPQIQFDIYALKVRDKLGFERNYTLVNFESREVFETILKHLSGLWIKNKRSAIAGRNFWINPKIKLEVTGIKNVVSSAQANPQVLLKSVKGIKIIK